MQHTIYRTTFKGGLDMPVGEIEAPNAVTALEGWAQHCAMDDFSIDTNSALRIILCTRYNRVMFYAYADSAEEDSD